MFLTACGGGSGDSNESVSAHMSESTDEGRPLNRPSGKKARTTTEQTTTEQTTTEQTTAEQVSSSESPASSPLPATAGYPFANQKLFVDPYSQAARYVNSGENIYPLDVMQRISTRPTAIWLGDWNANVSADVTNVMSLASGNGAMPVFVAYNIPQRDCGSYSSGGTTDSLYPQWIEQIAYAIGNRKAAVVLEPDALAQINQSGCLTDTQKNTRYQLIKNAIATFKQYAPNTAVYVDAGNPHWIPAATMAQNLVNAGIDRADGFALNVSNFFTTESNVTYGTQISNLTGGKHFVIDTSRNGLGPTSDYQWCNPLGRALGAPPQTFSSGLVDAYLWIKRPGESDGTCNGGPSAGMFWPQYAYDLAVRAK